MKFSVSTFELCELSTHAHALAGMRLCSLEIKQNVLSKAERRLDDAQELRPSNNRVQAVHPEFHGRKR